MRPIAPFRPFGQATGSSSTPGAISNGDQAQTVNESDIADQDNFSRASTYSARSCEKSFGQESFEDVSKDVELGTLPTDNPQVADVPKKRRSMFDEPRRTGLIQFLKAYFFTFLLWIFMALPLQVLFMLTKKFEWHVAFRFENVQVVDGIIHYENGTLAPLADFHLFGTNLTTSTCTYLTDNLLCTNESNDYRDVSALVALMFLLCLFWTLFAVFAFPMGVLKFRPGMLNRLDKPEYFVT